jgi:glycosyltransferase involved in cell wall biosynthesis
MKKVTVIIPTIGRPQYIKKALNSIIKQDYTNLEILISDNASGYTRNELIGDCYDPRIKYIKQDKRLESSFHMNLCIDQASSEYMMILSDDDILSLSYISNMVEMFSNSKNMTVSLGKQIRLSEHDDDLPLLSQVNKNTEINGLQFIKNQFEGKSEYQIYTYFSLFAKKKDILSAGGFKSYQDGSNADNFLFYSLAINGTVGLSGAVMGYRVYLKSSGLSTPFRNLYQATCQYDSDLSEMLWKLKDCSLGQMFYLRCLVKQSSIKMMIYRLLKIYRLNTGNLKIFFNLLRVILIFPFNFFFNGLSIKYILTN